MNALIVEDSRAQQLLIREYLRQIKITSELADDGAIALQMVRSGEYDLIICDIILPQMDGIALIQQIIKSCDHPVIIIAISGGHPNTVQGHLETAKIAGASAVLSKPFQKEALHKLIHQLTFKKT